MKAAVSGAPSQADVLVRLSEVEKYLDDYESMANDKAAKSDRYNKPLMAGYWRAVAIHVRHLRRRIRSLRLRGHQP